MRKITFCYFFFIFFQNQKSNAQTFRNMFDSLEATISEGYSFYSNLDGGIYNYESSRMDAYLNMFEATKDIKYLSLFAIHSKRVMDRRDDFIVNANPVIINPSNALINCTGNSWFPSWSTIYESCSVTGNISVVPQVLINNAKPVWSRPKCDEDCNLKPYPPFMESGIITFPMARFILLMNSSNLINELLPYEVNSSMNNSSYGSNIVTTYGQYAAWLKARVFETINWEINNDLVSIPFKHFESYWSVGSGGGWKGINQQCAIGRTLILMYYIDYLDGNINNYYRDIIEDIAYALYEDVHYSSVSLQYSTSSYYVWCHAYDCSFNSIFEDISHASLDQEFAELYMNYFHPVSGYGRFNISDMHKFANGESELVLPKPLETKMNVLGTNSSCDQMCNGDSIHYQYACLSYIFLSQYNADVYEQIADFFMPNNLFEINAPYETLIAYSLLTKYQNVFNPIAVKRSTFMDSHWAGCAGGNLDGDSNGLEEFATVRNKDGALEIFKLNTDNIITPAASIVNHPNNWAGLAAGKINNYPGELIFGVNNGDNSIYAYHFDGTSVGQIGGITTSYNGWKGIAVGDVVNSNPESEIAVLKENGLVSFYKFSNGQFTLIINEQTNIGSAVGITIGEFDINNVGNEIAIINNSNGHLNIYKLDNSNNYSLQLINSFTAANGTYNDWNGLTCGDYDNDGVDEIIAHRNYDGDFFVFKITNGQLQNNYTECFPTNTQHGVMGTMKYKGKDALLALRNYDGNMFMFTLDGYCPGLDLSSNINEYTSIDNSHENIQNQYPIDYHSDNTLTASNMTIGPEFYSNNETVHTKFISGKEIIFKPGFIVEPGAVMDAYIDNVNLGCDNNFNLKMAHQPNNMQTNKPAQNVGVLNKESISNETKNDLALLNLQINPNPTEGIFTLQLNKQINEGKVIIYDCLSKPIATYNLANNSSFVIDISNQAKGIYLVQFVTAEYSSTKRIVKN